MLGFEDKKFGYFYIVATMYFVALIVASFYSGHDQLGTAMLASYLTLSAYNLIYVKSSHEETGIKPEFLFTMSMISSIAIATSIFLISSGDRFIGAAVGASILILMIFNQVGKMFMEGREVDDNEEYNHQDYPVKKVEYCGRIVPLSLLLMTLACLCTIFINSEAFHADLIKNVEGCDHMF